MGKNHAKKAGQFLKEHSRLETMTMFSIRILLSNLIIGIQVTLIYLDMNS